MSVRSCCEAEAGKLSKIVPMAAIYRKQPSDERSSLTFVPSREYALPSIIQVDNLVQIKKYAQKEE
jgi:hypothetical protein